MSEDMELPDRVLADLEIIKEKIDALIEIYDRMDKRTKEMLELYGKGEG